MTKAFYKKAILMWVVFGLVYLKTYPATFIVDAAVEYDVIKQKRIDKFENIPGCFLPKEKDTLIWYVIVTRQGPPYLH